MRGQTGDDRTAGLLAAAALQSDDLDDVAYIMEELGLPEIAPLATDELPSLRAAVELAFSYAAPDT